ncbi:MAG: hypothetical protein V1754_04010, partial [Pseudomonadota bacterium]
MMRTISFILLGYLFTSGCATSNYNIPTEHAKRCFDRCKAIQTACRTKCVSNPPMVYGYGHGPFGGGANALLALVSSGADLGCMSNCGSSLDECAKDCGCTKNIDPTAQASYSVPKPRKVSRAAQLKKIREDEGAQEQLDKYCTALRAKIEEMGRNNSDGELPPSCPNAEDFIATCKQLLPAVAQCLHPDVMWKAPERCQRWM